MLAAAREVPQQPALLIDGREHSFASLVPRVERCLAFLRAQPLAQEPWPRVALLADNRVETALWLYALLELGVTAVLLHPRLVASERAALLGKLRAGLGACEVLFTKARGDATELAAQACAAGATTVVSLGGDGTHNEVVNGCLLYTSPSPRD